MDARGGGMKCASALNSIAACYRPAMPRGYRPDWVSAFLPPAVSASDGPAPEQAALAGSPFRKIVSRSPAPPEHDMTQLSPANAYRLKIAFQQCRDMEGT